MDVFPVHSSAALAGARSAEASTIGVIATLDQNLSVLKKITET